jgi:hypothetical protein
MNKIVMSMLAAFVVVCLAGKTLNAQTPPPAQPSPPPAAVQPAAAQPAAPAKSPKDRIVTIAVFTLGAQGVDQKVAVLVTDYLTDAVSRLPNVKVIGQKEIEAMLDNEQKKQMAGCTDTSCVVAIGGAMGADRLIMGNVGKLGTSYMFSVKHLDVMEAKVIGQFTKRLKGGTEEDFLDVVPDAVAAMFNLAAPSSPAAEKTPVGERHTPAPASEPSLGRKAPPAVSPANKIGPWVLIGIGAGAVIGGGACTGLAYSQYGDFEKLPQNSPKIPGMKDEIQAKETASFVLYGVGGASIIGGLVWYFVAGRAPAASASGIEFAPVAPIGSDAGGTVTWKW